MQKLAELEATAPKVTKKRMLREDSTTPPMKVANKPATLKDVFENMAMQKPIPVVGKQGDTQSTGAGFLNINDTSPAGQAMQKALTDLAAQGKAQIVMPTQPGQQQTNAAGQQATAAGQPNPNQMQAGQQAMQEESSAGGSKEELAKEIYKIHDRIRQQESSGVVGSIPQMTKKLEQLKSTWNYNEDPIKLGLQLWKQYHADQKAANASNDISNKAIERPKQKSFMGRMADKAKQVVGMKEEESMEESGLQAYLGNKKYGKAGMDALRKAGREHAGKEKMANIRAKYDKMDEEQLNELSPELLGRAADKAFNQGLDLRGKAFNRGQTVRKDLGYGHDELDADPSTPLGKASHARFKQHEKFSNASRNASVRDQDREDLSQATADLSPAMRRKLGLGEGDLPSSAGVDTKGAGLGAGRSQTTLEAKEPQVEVIDNAFNRENYKELIGKKYAKSKAPSYARVKEVTEGKKGVNPFAKKDDKASTKAPAKGKKPDFLDLDKDGDKKEPMKKAAADKKKQKVKESMNHRISAARLEGKSHGLRGHAHSGKRYEDMGEMKAYHEGYKEGLDECYGQGVYEGLAGTAGGAIAGGMLGGPLGAVAGGMLGSQLGNESAPAATVPGMASQAMPAMEAEFDEGNAFTAALAKTPKGGKFEVGGKTFTDRSNYGENVSEYAFESWDNQLNDLLKEGLSVSVSKGNNDSEDSVNINATGPESEQLMAIVKSAGLGLFGDDNADTHSSAMSIQPSHGAPDEIGAGGVDIGVVDGHDGMMGLMQKLSGIQSDGAADYADEEGDEEQLYGNHEEAGKKDCGCDGDCECSDYDQPANEQSCNECGGMMEAGHSCGSKMVDEVEDDEDHDEWHDKDGNVDPNGAHDAAGHYYRDRDQVDEVESEDQMEFEVSEANAPDSGAANATNDMQGNAAANASLAKADAGQDIEDGMSDQAVQESDDEEEETVAESFANLFKKLSFIAEESTEKEDDKAEKAGKKVAKDIEHDEGHKGKDDDKAEKAGEKVKKDIEYDDKKDKKEKVDEWANQIGTGPGKGTDASFEADIDFMTKVISGGLNKQKSTGQTTIPVIAGQTDRMGAPKEAVNESVSDWVKLAGIKK